MKKQAWRRQPHAYPLPGDLVPRHTDVDHWQHLNNSALIGMHGENLQRWLRQALGERVWRDAPPLIAPQASQTDFLAESHYPAALTTGVRLLGLDETGFRLGSALFQHGHCTGLHESTLACWDGGLPTTLPPAVVAAVQAMADKQTATHPAGDHDGPPPVGPVGALPVPDPVPQRSGLPWAMRITSRFADADAHGLASDSCLARCAEQMRVEFLTQVFGARRLASSSGFMVAHVALRWLQRGKPPAEWQVAGGVLRLSERSMSVRGAVFDGDTCLAVCDSVMVAIDSASRRSAPMPEASHQLLAQWLLPESARPAPAA